MSKYNQISLDFTEIAKLEERIKALPKKAEYEINNYLWNDAGNILRKQVYANMPRSQKDKSKVKKAPKVHAKDTNSLDKETFNLGVRIQTHLKPKSKDFGYLIFPDEGRGKHQKRKGAQNFFGRALDKRTNEIAEGLLNHLDKKIEEEL
ncbi:MAG TPA: hypothetical protein OIM45_08230 [Clostridiaceae bacterium]|nr:hypothetical protein [Clostridiaceae bacterium]